jgi:excisionase family DNA binding protein
MNPPTTQNADTIAQPLVRAAVIAKLLDVTVRTVHLWAVAGTIPCHRIGGSVRFDLAAVMAAISKGGDQ